MSYVPSFAIREGYIYTQKKVRMLEKLKAIAKSFKLELKVYQLMLKDSRTPRLSKFLLGLAVGYALLPDECRIKAKSMGRS